MRSAFYSNAAKQLELLPPQVFNKKTLQQQLSAEYPWLLSDSVSRRPFPSLWQAFKQRSYRGIAMEKCQTLLTTAYSFPTDFIRDAAVTLENAFSALNSFPSDSSDEIWMDRLSPWMVDGLSKRFLSGNRALRSQHHSACLLPAHSWQHSLVLSDIHITHGPMPAPADYVAQDWFPFYRLMIPSSDAGLEGHPAQKQVLKQAKDDGVFIRVTCVLDCPVELVICDTATQIPVLRDTRKRVSFEFVSPHFEPTDEIFDIMPDGSFRLGWNWKLCDIDSLMRPQS